MTVVVVEPPAPFVDLATAKAHLRVDHGDDDTLIEAYIAAACAHIDGPAGWLRRAIGEQTLEARFDSFRNGRCDVIRLPNPPIVDVVAVKYLAADGAEQTLDPEAYELTGGNELRPAYGTSWPTAQSYADAVRVTYDAGYATPPAPVVAAVLLMVGDLYEHRETTSDGAASPVQMSTIVENLLAPYRVWNL